jgi:hypothetical protein
MQRVCSPWLEGDLDRRNLRLGAHQAAQSRARGRSVTAAMRREQHDAVAVPKVLVDDAPGLEPVQIGIRMEPIPSIRINPLLEHPEIARDDDSGDGLKIRNVVKLRR